MLKRILVGVVGALTLVGAAFAEPWEDAMAAYERDEYATALQLWRPLAEQGDADAQAHLGVMYEMGQGVPQDYAEAVKWYRLAAEQGHAGGQNNLGIMYATGQGLPQDYLEAAKWFQLAAEQGNAGGQNNLGLMYATGEGLPQDYVLAYMWFSLAAAQGHDGAAENRDKAAGLMTEEQIAEAEVLAREWDYQKQN
jgi:TPR repeat protein